jgi:hypothetical protein
MRAIIAILLSAVAAVATTDADIERAIRARFAKSKISANRFEVRVQKGVATIEGRTAVLQHKGTATRLAKAAGAKSVRNKIQVADEAVSAASSNLAKGRRRTQAKRSEPRTEEPEPPKLRRAIPRFEK